MVAPLVVRHRDGSCPVEVRSGALTGIDPFIAQTWRAPRVVVIADAAVAARHPSPVPDAEQLTFPGGESHKTRAEWLRITDCLLEREIGRDAVLVAFGGGVTTDLVGFVAATLYRGVPWIAVPTTTLAMIDASVGGKTGVDTPAGKNLVGAFHPPAAVFIDPATLTTLPDGPFRQGLAEAVKHAAIRDAAYGDWLLEHTDRLHQRDPETLVTAIRRSLEIKAAVVAADEHEQGERAILNAGHTVAHAIEVVSNYAVPHGEAVAIGLVLEARLAERLGIATPGTADRISAQLGALHLPIARPAGLAVEALLTAMRADKKNRAGTLRLALLASFGAIARDGEHWTHPIDPTVLGSVLAD